MFTREKGRLHLLAAGTLMLVLYLLQYCGFLPAHGAAPVLLLPALIICAMFLGEWYGAILGLITGIFIDAVSVDAFCFNTVAMLLLGCAAGLFIHLLLNNTALSALLLCGGCTLVYVSARWVFFFFIQHPENAVYHYTHYSLPSVLITLLLSIPLYFIIRKMMKLVDGHYENR